MDALEQDRGRQRSGCCRCGCLLGVVPKSGTDHSPSGDSDAIGSRWYFYMKNKIDLVSVGTAHIEAEVDSNGHVQDLKVLSNNANEAFANICLQSFLEAKLPPIPPDLVAALPGGRMPVDFYFTTYSN